MHGGALKRGFATAVAVAAALLVAASPAAASEPRVVGGMATTSAAHPWQAGLVLDGSRFNGGAGQRLLCGGSLITSRIVQTAAHCVYDTDPDFGGLLSFEGPGGDGTVRMDPNDLDVVLGRTQLSSGEGAVHNVQRIYVHPGYSTGFLGIIGRTYSNDLAWIVLASPSVQQPIKIAGADERDLWTPGRATQVSGWGLTSDGGTKSDVLQTAKVPIVSDPSCRDAYGSIFNQQTMVCAGYLEGGADACNGDSGGPLQAPAEGGIFRLVGVVSFGAGCARPGYPGVYGRIADTTFRDFTVSKVSSIESAEGLSHEGIVGSGAVPPTGLAPATPSATASKKKRCGKKKKSKHRKQKRRKCRHRR